MLLVLRAVELKTDCLRELCNCCFKWCKCTCCVTFSSSRPVYRFTGWELTKFELPNTVALIGALSESPLSRGFVCRNDAFDHFVHSREGKRCFYISGIL